MTAAAPTIPAEKLAYNKRELLKALGLSATTLWRLEKRGAIVPVYGLRHKLYPRDEVLRFLREGVKA